MKKSTSRILSALLAFVFVATCFACYPVTVSAATYVSAANGASSSYKSGKYYQYHQNVTLTGNGVTDVLAMAISQLGYQEGNSAGSYAGTSSGSNNFTEYNYNMGDWGSGYGGSDYPWCACFVSWCLLQGGATTHKTQSTWCRNHLGDANYIWREISCHQWYTQLKNYTSYWKWSKYKGGSYTPVSGDLIFFANSSTTGHIGLVLFCDGSNVYTIEGNTSDAAGLVSNGGGVYFKSYALSSSKIYGYGHLPYKTASTATIDYSGKNPTAGQYMNTSTNKSIYSSASASGTTVGSIPAYTMFTVTEISSSGTLKVNYNGTVGYIANANSGTTRVIQLSNTSGSSAGGTSSATLVASNLDAHTIDGVDKTGDISITAGQTVGLRGWAGYTAPITHYGYYFDGNSAATVWTTDPNATTEAAVTAAGGANAKRYHIQANTSSLSAGNHSITYVLKLSDGSVQALGSLTPTVTASSSGGSTGTVSSTPVSANAVGGYVTALVDYHTINGYYPGPDGTWPDGQGIVLAQINDAPVGTLVGVRGWAGFSQNITAAGYYFDSNYANISWTGNVIAVDASNADDAGVLQYGGTLAKRYEITADTTGLSSGNHTVNFVLKLADGTVAITSSLALNAMTGGSSSGSSSSGGSSSTTTTITLVNKSIDNITTQVSGGPVYTYGPITAVNDFNAATTTIGLQGWVGYSAAIVSFGYYFDGDKSSAIFNNSYASSFHSNDDKAAIQAAGGANAVRFDIQAPMSSLSAGNHTLAFAAKFADGTIKKIYEITLGNVSNSSSGGSSSGGNTDSGNTGTDTPASGTVVDASAVTGSIVQNDFYTTNTVNQFSYSENVENWKTNIISITTADTAGLKGWVSFGSTAISQFGYYWDNDTSNITYNIGFAEATGSDVTAAGGANAQRFHIIASGNTAPSSGQHTLYFVAKLSNGTVARLGYWILNIQGTPTGGSSSDSGSTDSDFKGSGDPTFELQYPTLSEDMQPILAGNNGIIWEESVLFIDGVSTTKTLLYPIAEVLEVKFVAPKTGQIVYYQEGTHFTVSNGKISMISGSGIKCMPADTWNDWASSPGGSLGNLAGGKYWGEENAMTKWQVRVTYKTNSTWTGAEQTTYSDKYANFINKLKNGEDVTMIFYGDSITYGANASQSIGTYPSDGYSYSMLFTMALADLYDYKIKFVASPNGTPLPDTYKPASGGKAGTITYINSAVGGWTSADASANYATYVKNYATTYGCDFFSYAFGMNDGAMSAAQTASYANGIIADMKASFPNAAVAIISTMIPNPSSTVSIDYNGQKAQLAAVANKYSYTALVDMTTISQAIYNTKGQLFADYSGNNVNHPNDFLHRIYAQTLFEAVIGYENLASDSSIDYLPGNVNGDGIVNGKDITLIRRYNADWNVELNLLAADVNADGIVNGKDVTLVRRYNADWDVELLPGKVS